ncbi:MAG: PAS domain-containing sensor histidine kinase, partial [Flavobacteriales bacterium]
EQAPVAMALFSGADHRVDLANERVLELWGRTKEQVIGLPLGEAMPELGPSGIMDVLNTVRDTGDPFIANERPVPLLRDDQLETRYINFTYEGLRDPSGKVDRILAVGTDVTTNVHAREVVEEREKQFRLLADAMPQFVWTSDVNGMITYVNRSLTDFTGRSSANLLQNGWLQIIHPEDQKANEGKWQESMRTGTAMIFEHRFRGMDGQYNWQLSRGVPVRNEDGSIRMWIGTSTNVQQLKEQELERDYFIGVAGHEFRNPLNVLKGYLEMLMIDHEEGPDELLGKALRVMDRQVNNLTALTNELLDVSKLRAGALELQPTIFDLNALVLSTVGDMRFAQPTAVLEFERTAPVMVDADRVRIGQVLTNLLSNAVKYSPVGAPVEVELKMEAEFAVVKVRDHGIGINKEDQQRVFDRFYRVTGSDERRYQGFGIGLFLAADIVRLHKGTIGVESEVGQGSTFYFSVPLHK